MATVTKAYGGRAKILFHEVKHYYQVACPGIFEDKLYQPGVTTIIGKLDKSNALVSWATEQMAQRLVQLTRTAPTWDTDVLHALIDTAKHTYRKVKQEAADIGSVAHQVFEATLNNETLVEPLFTDAFTPAMKDQANKAVTAGLQFIRDHKIEVIHVEQPRWSPTHGYIGTGDLIAKIDSKKSVLDWKTSKQLYLTVKLQLAAYMMAYEEEHPGERIEQGVGVNTCKNGSLEPEFFPAEQLREDFKAFLGLLEAWRWDCVNQTNSFYNKPVPRRLSQGELQQILSR